MYQKREGNFTCLPQCKAFFQFPFINSWHNPTDKIKDFYFADSKWKLTAGKPLSLVIVQPILGVQSSDKNRSKIKMWVNHGVGHKYTCWKYPMKEYLFNPRFFFMHQNEIF